jgi:hypothetical protein
MDEVTLWLVSHQLGEYAAPVRSAGYTALGFFHGIQEAELTEL